MALIDLKKALSLDLETLRHLDLGIIPAKRYYGNLFLGWFLLFAVLIGIQSAACFFALTNQSWEYAPHERSARSLMEMNEFDDSFFGRNSIPDKFTLGLKFPHASDETLEKMAQEEKRKWEENYIKRKKERAAKLEEERLDDHLRQTIKMGFGVFFSSLFLSLFGLGLLKNYIIFKIQIMPRLQTGAYLTKKIHAAIAGFFTVFSVLAFIFIPLFEQDVVFFSAIPCFIGAAIATSIVINMEASRIGVSVLSKAISNFFRKEKEGSN